MLRGYALVDRRFSDDHLATEARARAAGVGFWSCGVIAPVRYETAKLDTCPR